MQLRTEIYWRVAGTRKNLYFYLGAYVSSKLRRSELKFVLCSLYHKMSALKVTNFPTRLHFFYPIPRHEKNLPVAPVTNDQLRNESIGVVRSVDVSTYKPREKRVFYKEKRHYEAGKRIPMRSRINERLRERDRLRFFLITMNIVRFAIVATCVERVRDLRVGNKNV